jgi:dUTP pyrophosphatase
MTDTTSPEEHAFAMLMRQDERYMNDFNREHIIGNYAVLKLAVQSDDPELLELYSGHIAKHNASLDTSEFPNSGFDLFVPETTEFSDLFRTKMVDLKVKCEMLYCNKTYATNPETSELDMHGVSYNCGYYVYPRSSMSKTPLMLANHVGIIDSGYRGNLLAAVRCMYEPGYVVEKHTRLFQICHPTLCPVYVVMVNTEDLSTTERGEGGFGSTGTKGATNA